METLPYLAIFTAVAIVSAISLVGVFTLAMRPEHLRRVLFILVSLAAGALFGNALFHLIPEALADASSPEGASIAIAAGILVFFILEKFLHWRHEHGMATGKECDNCDPHSGEHEVKPIGPLVLFADGLHNVTDGVIIASAFLIDPVAGIATTIAVVLHEIPQEIGDFGLLIHAGYTKGKAIFFNLCSALTAFVGAAFVLVAHAYAESIIPYLVAFAAGSFLYIAGSDLLPELHKTTNPRRSLIQLTTLIIGLGLMYGLTVLLPSHSHEGPFDYHEDAHLYSLA